jgi:nitrogen fixation NifU-like protein
MNSDASALILEYAKNPPNKGALPNPTFSYHESNRSCGDSMTVHVAVSDERVTGYSFEGDTAIVTTAAAAIFGEAIVGTTLEEILGYTYENVREMIGGDISPKRQMAACLALLATRNGIHEYRKDGKKDDFSDVIE